MSSNGSLIQTEKLTGRDNWTSWSFAVQAYLELDDLWECVQGTNTDPKKEKKAKSKLILLVDPINFIHIQDATTSKQIWENLSKAFQDSGLLRKVGLLRDLINTNLETSTSVEDYVNKIMSSAHKLRNIGFSVDDEWLGTLMLAGLPDEYKPMIMGIESSGVKISADLIKTKLLQEIKATPSNSALYTSNKNTQAKFKNIQHQSKSKGPRCFNCNKHGHLGKNCWFLKNKPQSKENNKGFVAAFSAMQLNDCINWYVDSGASMHMTMHKDLLENETTSPISTIKIADNKTLHVESCGDVILHIPNEDGGSSGILVKNVLYVPKLSTNLLSTSNPYTPQQNGLSERMNRTLVERAKCMMFNADLSKNYWAEAVTTAAYIINRSPTHALSDITPHEVWTGQKPDLSNIRIFGCPAMVHIPKEKRQKLDMKSSQLIFVGYSECTKGYRFMDPKTNKAVISRDVHFLEENIKNEKEQSSPNITDTSSNIDYEDPLDETYLPSPSVNISPANETGCGWESLMKSVTLGNVTMSHRTERGPPNALRLSHSTMIGARGVVKKQVTHALIKDIVTKAFQDMGYECLDTDLDKFVRSVTPASSRASSSATSLASSQESRQSSIRSSSPSKDSKRRASSSSEEGTCSDSTVVGTADNDSDSGKTTTGNTNSSQYDFFTLVKSKNKKTIRKALKKSKTSDVISPSNEINVDVFREASAPANNNMEHKLKVVIHGIPSNFPTDDIQTDHRGQGFPVQSVHTSRLCRRDGSPLWLVLAVLPKTEEAKISSEIYAKCAVSPVFGWRPRIKEAVPGSATAVSCTATRPPTVTRNRAVLNVWSLIGPKSDRLIGSQEISPPVFTAASIIRPITGAYGVRDRGSIIVWRRYPNGDGRSSCGLELEDIRIRGTTPSLPHCRRKTYFNSQVGRRKPKNITLLSFNTNGLQSNVYELTNCMSEYGIDIALIQETFLKSSRPKACAIAGYVQIRTDRTYGRRGGTALYYKSSIHCCPLDIPPLINMEATGCRLAMTGHGVLVIVSVYLSPSKSCFGATLEPSSPYFAQNGSSRRREAHSHYENHRLEESVETRLRKSTPPLNSIADNICTTDEIDSAIGALTSHIKTVVEKCEREFPASSDRRKFPTDSQTQCSHASPPHDIAHISRIEVLQKTSLEPQDDLTPVSLSEVQTLVKSLKTRKASGLDGISLIIDEQFGFRLVHSCPQQVLRLLKYGTEGFKRKHKTVAVFFDVAKAFDRVWHAGLVYKLYTLQVPDRVVLTIQNYLANRYFIFRHERTHSTRHLIRAGVPQGSALSPLLYPAYTNDVPRPSSGFQLALFAEDTALYYRNRYRVSIARHLQRANDEIGQWFRKWRKEINPDKSAAIQFKYSKHRSQLVVDNNISNLKMLNVKIPWQRSYKYLGVTLNRNLLFRDHIARVTKTALFYTARLGAILAIESKLSRRNKRTIYKMCIRTVITYASPVFAHATPTVLDRPQVIQNKFCRSATDAHWCVRNSVLHRDLKLPTISQYMKDASKRFFDIAGSHPNALHVAFDYEPPPFTHFIRKLRNVLNDPPDALTAAVESLNDVNDTHD
ncbi:Probable RNA-directed DNA polymerase from transposon BS [Eumeta japonica]|uniref:Probable RNA-directed DNA polymerase from transposon BS n=1 Tax=Eumeta variegata TaxID=151549 RepID=A0A4C1XYN7_EUMVA|nr:Probable RNA-directed DNA polymerase from transposon BS [Eumeta japonica]